MRPFPSLCLAFLAGFATACTELDDPPVWVDFDYQVRCVRCVPMAFNDSPRNVAALDGDDGLSVSCKADGDLIDLRVLYDQDGSEDDWAFNLERVDVNEGGPGGGCRISVQEGARTYRGSCSGDEPSEEAPCQVELTHEDYLVSGKVFCENIPVVGGEVGQGTRHITKPGSDTEPFEIEIHNCEGL